MKQFGLEITTLFYVSLGILNKTFFFSFFPFFFYRMPLNRNPKVNKGSVDSSFVNKETNHQARECLLCVSSVYGRHQIARWETTSLFYLRRECAGGMCKFCP